MNKKIVLIDGHSILHRAFYGMPNLTTSKGVHINAVYGFLNILFKVLDEENPSHLVVAFDMHAPTFRHKMFSEYKGTRKPMPDELRPQVPLLKEVLKSMNILIMEKEGLEADDLLGSMSRICEKDGFKVSIVSGDRDLLQLATENILVRIPKTKSGGTEIENYYPSDVLKKYQVIPSGIIDLKSLMGDSSDNIPGVPSIGEKTATNLLVEYKTLDNVYKNIENVKPPRAKKALEENKELAYLSYALATIKCDADIDFKIGDAAIQDFYNENSFKLFTELEFKRFLNRFDNDIAKKKVKQNSINIINTNVDIKVYLNAIGIKDNVISICFNEHIEDELPLFAGNGDSYSGVAITTRDGSMYIDFDESYSIKDFEDTFKTWCEKEANVIVFGLQQILHKLNICEVSEKFKNNIFDEKLVYYEIDPLKSEYNINDVSTNFGNVFVSEVGSEASNFKENILYNSFGMFKAYESMKQILCEKELENIYQNIDLPLAFSLYDMEKVGIKVLKEELNNYSKTLAKDIQELETKIYENCGEEFNINSPKQLGVILFEKLNLPILKKTKTGYSTAADVLEKLAIDFPIVRDILRYRTLSKLKSTYADGLQNFIGESSRIHGKFHQTITATGRISSSEPNLQNIPIRIKEGKEIRKVFVPREGFTFVDADYSQIELRILAHMSGDENLIKDFIDGKDIHKSTASKAFNIPFDEVTENDRRKAKAVNFGIVYGMSAFGLGEDLGISRKEAGEYIEKYFETYPKVKSFLDSQVEFAHKNSYVKTISGRIRPIPEINNSNFMRRSFGERVAMNSPIQGTAADIMKRAMYNVYKRLKEENLESKVVVQVHDELLLETKINELEIVKKIVREEMESAAKLSVPLLVDIGVGDNWLNAH